MRESLGARRLARRHGVRMLPLAVGFGLSLAVAAMPGLPRVTVLGTLGGEESAAAGINDRGEVIGTAFREKPAGHREWHAFLWKGGRVRLISTGLANSYRGGVAINNRGQALIETHGADWGLAFLWNRGRIVDLVTDPRQSLSANILTDRGEVIGEVLGPPGKRHDIDFLCLFRHGKQVNLSRLRTAGSHRLEDAAGMNSRGQIAGTGGGRALLLTLPERL